ncbi:protein TIFY 10A-like [Senna tora]|uniref:Protein TIFY n=1 Tax=Senna tora TaxID=362788 RepID=A0A834XG22_9FABA|nr:protein TIFY 10A-like [Senna tora]
MSTFSDTAASGGRRAAGKAAERCNLISQFLKEKRSSGGALSLVMAATMNLLTNLEKSEDDASKQNASLSQMVENLSDFRNPAKTESKTPQMAIFYAGKVLVFDAFPPEKATEIMELATKLSSNKNNPVASENLNKVVSQTTTSQEASRPRSQTFGSDMRYPRRASLVKFLEKRKERVIARGPYHQMNPKQEGGSNSSGDQIEDESCKPFDLNL